MFYRPDTYLALKSLGFTWASNREIRMPEELLKPGRLPLPLSLLRLPGLRQLLLIALNPGLILRERHIGTGGPIANLRWLLGKADPFDRPEGLREYPLTSPLDCDLVGLPLPGDVSGDALTSYATQVITGCHKRSGAYFNVNAHDWITGTQDRLAVLDRVLAAINAHPGTVYFRPGLDDDRPSGTQETQS
jgi:hypothetical protein